MFQKALDSYQKQSDSRKEILWKWATFYNGIFLSLFMYHLQTVFTFRVGFCSSVLNLDNLSLAKNFIFNFWLIWIPSLDVLHNFQKFGNWVYFWVGDTGYSPLKFLRVHYSHSKKLFYGRRILTLWNHRRRRTPFNIWQE